MNLPLAHYGFGLEHLGQVCQSPRVIRDFGAGIRLGWLCRVRLLFFVGAFGLMTSIAFAADSTHPVQDFPPPLESYGTPDGTPLFEVLKQRAQAEPMNLVATILFFLAITHTFLAPMFVRLSHHFEKQHQAQLAQLGRSSANDSERGQVSFLAELFHFFGEVEAIFGIWVVPLLVAITVSKGWPTARDYLAMGTKFTEPLFVVVVMSIAASRPILNFAEQLMGVFASLGKGSPAAWWLSILTVGPVLGSFITEPAAMTISALLLASRFYRLSPKPGFAYATLGLLFVNISVGGTLTHFAAPPVLMVAGKWNWNMTYMLTHFGWKAILGVLVGNAIYFGFYRSEFRDLSKITRSTEEADGVEKEPVPSWITAVHVLFLAWTVMNSHYPALFIGGFLFYLAFTQATEHHQSDLALKPALLVGFFLAGLVVHGGLQGWWIVPVLSGLKELPLFFGAVALTAFNDNAAITYLASLVPEFSAAMKYAVVAGAVAGGGLTVIANAPNPAGQSILSKFFPGGISPLRLLMGALVPTVIVSAAFLLLRSI